MIKDVGVGEGDRYLGKNYFENPVWEDRGKITKMYIVLLVKKKKAKTQNQNKKQKTPINPNTYFKR